MTKFEDTVSKKNYTIYRLWHDSTPGVRYVGLTTQPLIERLIRHIWECSFNSGYNVTRTSGLKGASNGSNKPKTDWLRSLLEKGLAPHIDTLETHYGTFAEARAIEDSWMMHYLGAYGNHSFTLLNAKLPKQAQILVKGEPPVSDTYYEQKETNRILHDNSLDGSDCFNRIMDAIQNITYTPVTYQLGSPLPNYFTLACDNEK